MNKNQNDFKVAQMLMTPENLEKRKKFENLP